MVKYFQKTLGGSGEVHVCNSDDRTVAFHYADKSIVSPLIYSDEYIPFLLNYCEKNEIRILISLFDMDLPVLSKNREKFEKIGTRVIVSNSEIIEMCNDKWKTYTFLKQNGFNVPKTYLSLTDVMNALSIGEIEYPVVVKPRFGCGSIAVSIAEDESALLYCTQKSNRTINTTYLKYELNDISEKIIFQQCLKGQEYGADIINDLDGTFQNAVIKKKIAMRAGETDIAQIVYDSSIYNEVKRLGELTGHISNMDCDIFVVDGKPYILEMNARFGGGYPFSHMGGCNLPEAIVKWVNGQPVDPSVFHAKNGLVGYKELFITCTEDNG